MPDEDPQIETARDQLSDTFVSRAVIDGRLVSPQELQACQHKQDKLAQDGKHYRLADILIKAGFVTKSQIKRLPNQADDSMAQSLQHVPGFLLMRKIGAGAMASVYKAKQLSLDRIVAIKILPKRLSEDPSFVQRFHKEGRAAAKLSHNNIVQAIDVGEHLGYHYFVMEFVDGKTVYDELAEKGKYKEAEALDIIIQIARALDHAHARGFIHRDVKPKNIMITKEGVAKLADMGLAREASDIAAAAAEKGRAYGTPYYISPEQIRGVSDVDFRADIYSLGATFYHMVTGRVPFEGHTPAEIMHKHLREPLVPPDHINTELSSGLGEVIERAMAKDRRHRYASTQDMLVDLELVRRGEPPLQARSRFDEKLLQNLSQGTPNEAEDWRLQAQNLPMGRQANYLVPLVVMIVLEVFTLVILIAVMAMR